MYVKCFGQWLGYTLSIICSVMIIFKGLNSRISATSKLQYYSIVFTKFLLKQLCFIYCPGHFLSLCYFFQLLISNLVLGMLTASPLKSSSSRNSLGTTSAYTAFSLAQTCNNSYCWETPLQWISPVSAEAPNAFILEDCFQGVCILAA